MAHRPGHAGSADARERILDAMLDLGSSQGYEATGVEGIIERAGASREEFDRLFSSKEDCAIAVFERSLASFRRAVLPAYESEERWQDALRAGAHATSRWIGEHPRDTHFGAVELLWAGEMAQTAREAAFQSFIGLIDAGREWAEDPDSVPAHTAEGVMGSLAEIITKRSQRGDLRFFEVVPEIMYLAVKPYLGEEAAARELAIPAPGRPSDGE